MVVKLFIKKIDRQQRWLIVIFFGAFSFTSCNNSPVQAIKVHLSAYSPAGHLSGQLITGESTVSFGPASPGNTTINYDGIQSTGKKIRFTVTGAEGAYISAFINIDGKIVARGLVQSNRNDSDKLTLSAVVK